ncbi:amidase family protein [Pseudomonas yamanorum]|uniref:amidase family protein n=1 Tax=Pseudomonas yamanorum TaxID=515393 RepID=UPI0015A3DA96|nr:amidase family protein [Pseudomonas yamanorum]NWD25688.1 amidase family protein [Pseudomonas yamanorum]
MIGPIWTWDAVDVASGIRSGLISSREAVQASLDRLAVVNPSINAVTVVDAEQALSQADDADRAVLRGDALGLLHGVPVTTKENVDQAGAATTHGVVAFKGVIALSDSPVVANLRKAGAIVMGRTNMSAFALRWHTDNDLHGPTFNPWSRQFTAGGSSGGAAASVAAGITALAHGNDYGGSIRYPAYCCGLVGLKPTLGRVPHFNPSAKDERSLTPQLFSAQGPIARRVRDLRVALQAMSLGDARDPSWVSAPLEGPRSGRLPRVAMTINPSRLGVHPAVEQAVRKAADALARAGYEVEEVEPPDTDAVSELWWRLAWWEFNELSGAGIRKLGDEGVKRAFEMYVKSTPKVDLQAYMRAVAARATHLRKWLQFLERYPLILGPVSAELPFPVDFDLQTGLSGETLRRAQRLLIAVNVLGLPAVAVPTGLSNGIPVGVQLIGSQFREDLCLDAAQAIEARLKLDTPIEPRL